MNDKAVIIDEQVIELPDDVVALIAATFSRDPDTIEADAKTWEEVRRLFPADQAPEPGEDGMTRLRQLHRSERPSNPQSIGDREALDEMAKYCRENHSAADDAEVMYALLIRTGRKVE